MGPLPADARPVDPATIGDRDNPRDTYEPQVGHLVALDGIVSTLLRVTQVDDEGVTAVWVDGPLDPYTFEGTDTNRLWPVMDGANNILEY